METTSPLPNVTTASILGSEAREEGLGSRDYLNETDWLIHGWITADEIAPGNIVLGLLAMACFMVGTSGNLIALTYYLRHPRKRLSTHLYSAICAIDCAICFLSFSIGLSGITNNSSILYSNRVYCTMWTISWFTLDRLMIFVLVTFSVTRTLSLCCPFFQLRTRSVLIPIFIYLVICFVESLMPVIAGVGFHHTPYHSATCNFRLSDVFPFGSLSYTFFTGVFVVIQYDLPVGVMITSNVMAALELRNRSHRDLQPALQNSKESACWTMVIITSVYVTLNLPFCVYYTLHLTELITHIPIVRLTYTNHTADVVIKFISEFMTVQVIPLIATLEMVILFVRNPTLRNYAMVCFGRDPAIMRGRNEETRTTRRTTLSTRAGHSCTVEMIHPMASNASGGGVVLQPRRPQMLQRSLSTIETPRRRRKESDVEVEKAVRRASSVKLLRKSMSAEVRSNEKEMQQNQEGDGEIVFCNNCEIEEDGVTNTQAADSEASMDGLKSVTLVSKV